MVIEHSFINKSYTSKINSASLWWRYLLKFIEVYGKTTEENFRRTFQYHSNFFYMNRNKDYTQETYSLKSLNCPPKIKGRVSFQKDL